METIVDDGQEGGGSALKSTSMISLEDFLSVPLEILFRASSNSRRRRRPKKAWSKAEVLLLTQVQLWASEVDCLIEHVLLPTLQNQQWAEQFAIQDCLPYATLRSVGVLALSLMCHKVPAQVQTYVQSEMDRILAELQQASALLTHYAEQNYNLADSLWDALQLEDEDDEEEENDQETQERLSVSSSSSTSGHYLVEEKRILAQVMEQVASRIQHLFQHASSDAVGGTLFLLDDVTAVSMADFSERLFQKLDNLDASARVPRGDSEMVSGVGGSSAKEQQTVSTQSPSTTTAAASRQTSQSSPERHDAVAAMMSMASATTTSTRAVASSSSRGKKKKRRLTAADDPALNEEEAVCGHDSQAYAGGSQVTPEHRQQDGRIRDDCTQESRHLHHCSAKDSDSRDSDSRDASQRRAANDSQNRRTKLPPAGFTQPISTSHLDEDEEMLDVDESQTADTQTAIATLKNMGRKRTS